MYAAFEDSLVLAGMQEWTVRQFSAHRAVFSFHTGAAELGVDFSSDVVQAEDGSPCVRVEAAAVNFGRARGNTLERALVASIASEMQACAEGLRNSKQLSGVLRQLGGMLGHVSDVVYECSDIAGQHETSFVDGSPVMRVAFQTGSGHAVTCELEVGGAFTTEYPLGPLKHRMAESGAGQRMAGFEDLCSKADSVVEAYSPEYYSYGRLLDICDALKFLMQQF
eukprot:TRINITY_DN8534_c0_g1_i1.p1 TRINITY_DN8534_c0_g1~~TRINITY_DN8534_c0_g1_i1.p1  ORF type:complete len:253 (+),score=113.50 TRINITY_DN8534_c0_g1_i1:93-761(+)